jgi:hypothetical protein
MGNWKGILLTWASLWPSSKVTRQVSPAIPASSRGSTHGVRTPRGVMARVPRWRGCRQLADGETPTKPEGKWSMNIHLQAATWGLRRGGRDGIAQQRAARVGGNQRIEGEIRHAVAYFAFGLVPQLHEHKVDIKHSFWPFGSDGKHWGRSSAVRGRGQLWDLDWRYEESGMERWNPGLKIWWVEVIV